VEDEMIDTEYIGSLVY